MRTLFSGRTCVFLLLCAFGIGLASAADAIKPTILITSPKAAARLTSDVVTIAGTARDNVRLSGVQVNVNGGPWTNASSANVFTNWTVALPLTPGANILRAFAIDTTGNHSLTGSVTITYAVNASLPVQINGPGKVIAAPGGTLSKISNVVTQEIGKSVTLTATPLVGARFDRWDGTTKTTKPSITFTMASNLTVSAMFTDIAKPTLAVKSPTAISTTTNPTVTVNGVASDNVGVAQVFASVNGGDGTTVNTGNHYTNWSAAVNLMAGLNTLRFYAVDAAGNTSIVSQIKVTYKVTAPFTVAIDGPGKVSATPGGTLANAQNIVTQETGATVRLMAMPVVGAKFSGWTGSITSTAPAISFVMASNLTFTAHFTDTTKPIVTIKTPGNNSISATPQLTVAGTASDNVGVGSVFVSVNGGAFAVAEGSATWIAPVELSEGLNTIRAYAVDTTGIPSSTNSITVTSHTGLAELYWPMADGDQRIFSAADRLNFSEVAPGKFYVDISGQAAMTYSYNLDRSHARLDEMYANGTTLTFSPPLPHIDAALLVNGGAKSYSGLVTIQGVSIQATLSVTVVKAGTVTTPLGTFTNCWDSNSKITLTGNGQMRTVPFFRFILAPHVGPIQFGIYSDANVFVGWENLVSGTVEGVDIQNWIPTSGMKYGIDVVIADVGDGNLDSAVFLGAGSFQQAPPASPPMLEIATSNGSLLLKWTDGSSQLESTVTFGPDAKWEPISTPVTHDDSGFSVTIPLDSEARYFRLQIP
jgi:hypothetical protein